MEYHRSLDGLRGVAILLVLIVHGGILEGTGYSFIGVNTFFVLSGFLITSLLLREYDQTRDISLRHFYIRRALRLLPALTTMMLAFVMLAVLLDPLEKAVQEMYEALRALFYFTNWARIYSVGEPKYFSHTWSLSIEEQFYLIWPVLLLLLIKRNSRHSLLCWALLGITLSVAARILLYLGTDIKTNTYRLSDGLDTRADSLLLGCYAAILVSSNLLPRQKWFPAALKISALAACGGLVLLGIFYPNITWVIWIGWVLASALAVILITFLVTASGSLLHRVFENPILVYIGQISYGLYLWHFPVLIFMQNHHMPWQHFLYLLPVLMVSLTSYYLIERPCLRLKGRFARVNCTAY